MRQSKMLQFNAMKHYEWEKIEKEQLSSVFARQVIHADQMTVARVYLKKGAIVPRHSHVNEQITLMQEGKLRFVFDDREVLVCAGDALQIKAHEPHSAESLEDSVAIDLFSPTREDWIRGDDAYLRGK
jgi:quercetin dioxygenase-like cupin family protein